MDIQTEKFSRPKASPKDVFIHLLMIGTLYASAVSFIALLWQYVNRFFADALEAPYGDYGTVNAIRWSLSSVVILFPVFLWAMRFLERDMLANPEKRTIAIRKWLLHLTLFVAGITIIVDLITLLYNYLGGELSARFFLKILVILFVAAAIFTYYIWELRRDTSLLSEKMRYLAWMIVGVVAVASVGGFFIAGSPQRERMRRFDERRVGDLQSVQYQIIDYWQRKEKLPETLSDLKNDISGFVAPQDPETQVSYGYRRTGDLSFELCGVFSLDVISISDSRYPKVMSVPAYGPYGETGMQNWEHGKGEKCFSRTIDPKLYPPYPKTEKIPPPMR
ncbi:MAG: DUF5671 domain-containing protein [bacterium]|nr:DUF5671 domain-containing protein [bacterium]